LESHRSLCDHSLSMRTDHGNSTERRATRFTIRTKSNLTFILEIYQSSYRSPHISHSRDREPAITLVYVWIYIIYDIQCNRPSHTSQWKSFVGHDFSDDCSGERVRRERNGKIRNSGVIFSASFDPYICIMYMYKYIIAGVHIHIYAVHDPIEKGFVYW